MKAQKKQPTTPKKDNLKSSNPKPLGSSKIIALKESEKKVVSPKAATQKQTSPSKISPRAAAGKVNNLSTPNEKVLIKTTTTKQNNPNEKVITKTTITTTKVVSKEPNPNQINEFNLKSSNLKTSVNKEINKEVNKEKSSKAVNPKVSKKEVKSNAISPEEEELKAGFELFDVKHKGKIHPAELQAVFTEMKLDEKFPYLTSVIDEIDEEITYEDLMDILNEKMEDLENEETLRRLFDFFLEESGGENKLPFSTFVKMAKELREETTEKELRELLQSCGCYGEELTFDDFKVIMNEAGLVA